MNLCFLDSETTGLEPDEGAVMCSIAFLLTQDGEVLQQASFVFTPSESEWSNANPKALAVNGLTMEYLKSEGMPREEQEFWMRKWLLQHGIKDYTLVGQNIGFDLKFLRYHFAGSLEWIGFPFSNTINVMDIAKQLRTRDRSFRPTTLSGHNISKALGVREEDKVHTAIGGAEVVKRNYEALVERLAKVKAGRIA